MAQFVTERTKTFTAGAAIGENLRVKISSGVLAVAGVGASDEPVEIGTMEAPSFASGDKATVVLRSAQGTVKMVAAAAITAGAAVYGAASGQISSTSSGNQIGIALEAAGAANDVIEVQRI